jgi:hypothetical protein
MKTDRQFKLLRGWIEAIVDEKVEQAFNRDSSIEELRRKKIEAKLLKLIEESQNGNEGKNDSEENNFER